jgi:hypothetical protein
MLISGPVGKDWRSRSKDKHPKIMEDQDFRTSRKVKRIRRKIAAFRKLASDQKIEFFDMATPWHKYLAASDKPFMWFHRDRVHANDRGKQILGRLLERYFSPK